MNNEPTKTSIGDTMQSSASRLIEFLRTRSGDIPYEVRMAMAEGQRAIDQWTELRKKDK